ncbi:hypothetical protein N9N67_08055 [Bacteriovoracaceae bacterium]|nr:hypothetical protein [Bacteriovoracaceae bacterium]
MINDISAETHALTNTHLTMQAFYQLSGNIDGINYIKIVVEAKNEDVHFMNDHYQKFHAKYIAGDILNISENELTEHIDELNEKFYYGTKRDLLLGILSLYSLEEKNNQKVFILETVEVDTMESKMIIDFYQSVKRKLPKGYSLLFKPANHHQELEIKKIAKDVVPRIMNHELTKSRSFITLNSGEARGRLRYFKDKAEYLIHKDSIAWYDIIVMKRVPDSIPRIAGIINANYTTPLSHTNILACGWQVPNAIQIDVEKRIVKNNLNNKWVYFKVGHDQDEVLLEEIKEVETSTPQWKVHQVQIEKPRIEHNPILNLEEISVVNIDRYGTKAANLGEVFKVLKVGSPKFLDFYNIERGPRENLLRYAQKQLHGDSSNFNSLLNEAYGFLKKNIVVPKGICLPFSLQQKFLAKSPQIQQQIGKLKFALETNHSSINSLCVSLQQMIIQTPLPAWMSGEISKEINKHLWGCKKFVVRSSSNAEDLHHFSAAGIYESYNHIDNIENIFESIKKVWASLVSTRCVLLRKDAGISLDDTYMGVIIQEEVSTDLGGVLVTANPLNSKEDYRNVFINASSKSSIAVVQGEGSPYQLLYNIVEGGGRTLLKGQNEKELTAEQLGLLEKLAISGKLLEGHFAPENQSDLPVDIEWALGKDHIYLLQIRPYQFD